MFQKLTSNVCKIPMILQLYQNTLLILCKKICLQHLNIFELLTCYASWAALNFGWFIVKPLTCAFNILNSKQVTYDHVYFVLQVHNNRLSRCRRLIENSFGILANTWRIMLRRIDLQPEKVCTITLTVCLLHNMLRENRTAPTGAALEPINAEESFGELAADGARGTTAAMQIRNKFKQYVNNNPILY